MVDSVKAATQLPGVDPGKRVVTLGWSQGGGTAIFTGQQAETSYARPFRVIGIAALAPAANNGPDLEGKVPLGPLDSTSPYVLGVQQLDAIRGAAAAYPDLDVSDVITPAGMPALNALNVECTIHLQDVLQELGVDPGTFFKRPFPAAWLQVIPFAAMKEYVPWIKARFAGKPAPSNCSSQ